MKKIIIALGLMALFMPVSAKAKNADKKSSEFVKIEAGKAVISNIDADGKAVRYNQKIEDNNKVTVIDCSKSTSKNLATVSLADYGDMDITVEFSCDLKIVNTTSEKLELNWFINEPSANLPVIAGCKSSPDTWIHFSGKKDLFLNANRQFYLSGFGVKGNDVKIYIKNFRLIIHSDQLGAQKFVQESWLNVPSLAKTYEPYFDYIGFATPMQGVLGNKDVVKGLEYQASCYTMENEFKPDFIFAWQKPGNFKDFQAEDGKYYPVPGNTPVFDNVATILNIAKTHNLKMRGHVLVWHSQTPDWFFRANYGDKNEALVDEATMNARMEWYIKSVLEYIKNWEDKNNNGNRIVITWDVVNEAASDNSTKSAWLRTDSNWYRVYKSDRFIVNAFRYANKYAPKDVLLAYNDYGCASYNKCTAILQIVDAIQAAPDARIDIVGMQSHIGMNTRITGVDSFETSVKRFLEKGVNVQITELDIGQDGQGYSATKLKNKYNEFFKMCLANRKTETKNGISGITLWGIVDERSWIYNNNGQKQHPLLFEKDYVCKPAFYGVLEAVEE